MIENFKRENKVTTLFLISNNATTLEGCNGPCLNTENLLEDINIDMHIYTNLTASKLTDKYGLFPKVLGGNER